MVLAFLVAKSSQEIILLPSEKVTAGFVSRVKKEHICLQVDNQPSGFRRGVTGLGSGADATKVVSTTFTPINICEQEIHRASSLPWALQAAGFLPQTVEGMGILIFHRQSNSL